MPLPNLPPRLLRVIVGCIVVVATLGITYGLLAQRFTPAVPLLHNGTMAFELPNWPALKPTWTTEQEEPKFAYAQYATTVDYLCNAVSYLQHRRRKGCLLNMPHRSSTSVC